MQDSSLFVMTVALRGDGKTCLLPIPEPPRYITSSDTVQKHTYAGFHARGGGVDISNGSRCVILLSKEKGRDGLNFLTDSSGSVLSLMDNSANTSVTDDEIESIIEQNSKDWRACTGHSVRAVWMIPGMVERYRCGSDEHHLSFSFNLSALEFDQSGHPTNLKMH